MNARNEILAKQEMAKRARIKKEFLAHAQDFYNDKYSIEKFDGGYILKDLSKCQWTFKIMPDGIQQLSEGPTSSSDYWAHAFMEAWMSFPKTNNTRKK